MAGKNHQARGFGAPGTILAIVLALGVIYVALAYVPVFIEYYAIRQELQTWASQKVKQDRTNLVTEKRILKDLERKTGIMFDQSEIMMDHFQDTVTISLESYLPVEFLFTDKIKEWDFSIEVVASP